MADVHSIEETLAAHMDKVGSGIDNNPDANENESVDLDLWGSENTESASLQEELSTPDNLKFKLESLTIEKERLKKENRKLAELLESIKLEEDIAALAEEVSQLGGEKEQLLAEIQRRKQSV